MCMHAPDAEGDGRRIDCASRASRRRCASPRRLTNAARARRRNLLATRTPSPVTEAHRIRKGPRRNGGERTGTAKRGDDQSHHEALRAHREAVRAEARQGRRPHILTGSPASAPPPATAAPARSQVRSLGQSAIAECGFGDTARLRLAGTLHQRSPTAHTDDCRAVARALECECDAGTTTRVSRFRHARAALEEARGCAADFSVSSGDN